jgi:hypothetical protein
MSEYKWCHGPNCHKRHTTTRVRGVKGNKVLRTVKIRANNWNKDTTHEYFCDQTCLMDFINKHMQEFVRLHPRTDCLETPVTVTKEDNSNQYYNYVRTNIEVDESRNIG